jgi:hypothetical protein
MKEKNIICLENMNEQDLTENDSEEENYCKKKINNDFGFEQPEIKRFAKMDNKSLFDRINSFSVNNETTPKISNIRQYKDNISFSQFAQPITPVSRTKKIIEQHPDNQKISREEVDNILNKIEPFANKSTDNPNNYQLIYSQIKHLFEDKTAEITKMKMIEILNSYGNMYYENNNIFNQNNYIKSMFNNSPAMTPNTGSDTCKNHIEVITPNHHLGVCNYMIDNSPLYNEFNNCISFLANSPRLNLNSPMNVFLNSPFNNPLNNVSNRLSNINFTDLVKNLGYKTNY